jgi:hypothetical protein
MKIMEYFIKRIYKYPNFLFQKKKWWWCEKNKKGIKGDFSYCSKCNKFLCYLFIVNHTNSVKHSITNYKRY